jgi:hypothetical protein
MRENERERERVWGKRGGGGGRHGLFGPKGGAPGGGWAGRGRPTAREREKKEKENIFEIRSFYMNAFALSKQSKEMQGSAWCIKQHKVFRVFYTYGNSKPNPARTLEKVKV